MPERPSPALGSPHPAQGLPPWRQRSLGHMMTTVTKSKSLTQGWRPSSVVEHLPFLRQALGSIPSTAKMLLKPKSDPMQSPHQPFFYTQGCLSNFSSISNLTRKPMVSSPQQLHQLTPQVFLSCPFNLLGRWEWLLRVRGFSVRDVCPTLWARAGMVRGQVHARSTIENYGECQHF